MKEGGGECLSFKAVNRRNFQISSNEKCNQWKVFIASELSIQFSWKNRMKSQKTHKKIEVFFHQSHQTLTIILIIDFISVANNGCELSKSV
jgi:hypothetical protein